MLDLSDIEWVLLERIGGLTGILDLRAPYMPMSR
jgi:hypothetical protein